MIYSFITDEDILLAMKQDLLLDIIPENEKFQKIKRAENAVLKQIRSKAGKWYDFNSILSLITQWNTNYSYLTGNIVYDNGLFYKALINNIDLKPSENLTQWENIDDPRHSLLVMYAVDMLLYHLHSSINPRKIPELRKERYQEAKQWLQDIATSKENADFPTNILDDERVIWGSNPKIDNNF